MRPSSRPRAKRARNGNSGLADTDPDEVLGGLHRLGGGIRLHALVEGRHPDGVRPPEARPVYADAPGVHALDRLQVGDGVVGVLGLLQRALAAALALALAEAAVVRREDEVALLPKAPRRVHAIDLLHPAVAVQADDGGPRRVARPPVPGRIEVGGYPESVAVVENFLIHADSPCGRAARRSFSGPGGGRAPARLVRRIFRGIVGEIPTKAKSGPPGDAFAGTRRDNPAGAVREPPVPP